MRAWGDALLSIALAVGLAACELQDGPQPGAVDAAHNRDGAVTIDGAPGDAPPGPLDGGGDAAAIDASPVDASPVDAGVVDAGAIDASPVDASPIDAGPADAAPGPDAAPPPPLLEGLATLAGSEIGVLLDGDRATARFRNPVNLVADADGSLLVADQDGHAIRRVSASGDVTTVSPPGGGFLRPFGMVRIGEALYVETDLAADGQNRGALWQIDLPGGQRTLLLSEEGEFASRYRGLAALSDGRLVLVNYLRHTLYTYDPASGVKALLAGADGAPGFVDAPTGSSARFDRPYDVLVLPGDLLLVADFGNHRIRLVTAAGAVSTYAGSGTAGAADGSRLAASFDSPQALAIDGEGNVYVTDTGNFVVRRIDAAGQVTTIAGNGVAGWADSLTPRSGSLYGLEGATVLGGYLYLSDGNRGDGTGHHRVRRLTLH